jgi:hypothetical protein
MTVSTYVVLSKGFLWIITDQNIKDLAKRYEIWNQKNKQELKM